MRINSAAVATAFFAMAISSLLVIILGTRLDNIVHVVLYNFGLRFSYLWATPYWTYSALIVSFSWFNIIGATLLTYLVFKRGRVPPTTEIGFKDEELQFDEQVESFEQPALLTDLKDELDQTSTVHLQIKEYDVTHPPEVIDSQC